MRHHRSSQTPGDARHTGAGRFARLYDLSDLRIARGEPDVRGWHIKTADGERAGRVDSLIVDTEAMQVRYLDVELDRKTFRLKDERHVLVPLADARLDDDHDDVLLDTMTAAEVATLPPYHPGQPITLDPEAQHRDTASHQFYGKRGGTGAVERRTGAEMADDADSMQRRDPRDTRSGRPEDQEVRIPLTGEEEVVIEKRAVPTEEVVIRKKGAQPGERGDPGSRRDH